MMTKSSGSWMRWMAVGLAGGVSALIVGCSGAECVDRFDCQIQNGSPGAGNEYACQANVCVVRPVPPADAGTTVDAGTPTDAGTPVDAGTSTDGGLTCATRPHDAKLGTLLLQSGFTALESAPLPENIGAITAVAKSGSYTVYGADTEFMGSASLYAIGTWPNIVSSTTPLYPIVPGDEQGRAFFSDYVVSDGVRVMAGYTLADLSGKVALYDTATPSASTYVAAESNFSAVGLEGALFINGLGLETASGLGVYALKTRSAPFQASKLATFPSAAEYSGFSALTSNQIAVFGYAYSTPMPGNDYASTNVLRAVSPGAYTPALTAGTTLDLSGANTPEIHSSLTLRDAAGFGAGVALRQSPNSADYGNTRSVSRLALTPTADGQGVTVGASQPVLTQNDTTCTQVVLMAPLGEDLLVGVEDKNGRRLVRLHMGTP